MITLSIVINVDRAKSAQLGLTQADVMRAIIAALNSSIQFNKHNFWIDPKSKNQYYVGVSYFEKDIESIDTLLDIPITSPVQNQPIPMRNVVRVVRKQVPTEVTHYNIQPTIELTMGVEGRDLGHVSDDVSKVLNQFGEPEQGASWAAYDPASKEKKVLVGTKIKLSGEYLRMTDTFNSLGVGLCLAALLDLLPHGRAGPVVAGAALGHVDRPLVLDRHHADALPHEVGRERAIACWDSSSSSASRWPTRCS